jgi:phosphoribosyl-ATP pyrophosphohydrolase
MLRPEQDGWKLIRHKMPESSEKPMIVRRVVGEEHVTFLGWKLEEEAREVEDAVSKKDSAAVIKEAADVRQVLSDLCRVAGILPAKLSIPPVEGVPKALDERREFFRAQVDRLVALSESVASAERADLMDRVGEILGALNAVTDVAGIREQVVREMQAKFEERGGFDPGIAWKIVEKAS